MNDELEKEKKRLCAMREEERAMLQRVRGLAVREYWEAWAEKSAGELWLRKRGIK